MDLLTIIGFILGAGCLAFGLSQGGSMKVFFNLHAVSIVLGGTLAMTLVNSTFHSLGQTLLACVKLFFPGSTPSIPSMITLLRQLAEQAKANGVMSLQNVNKRVANGFLARATNVAVVSGQTDFTRDVLEEDILQMRLRHMTAQSVLRTAGVLSPMVGLLGTLIGIVHVLQNISDPTKVGPSMATALSTAFFGILLAAFFFVPMAGKLRERSNAESLLRQLIVEGVVGILKDEPPYLLELRLRSFARAKGAPSIEPPLSTGRKAA